MLVFEGKGKKALSEHFTAVWCIPVQLVNVTQLFLPKSVKYYHYYHDILLESIN